MEKEGQSGVSAKASGFDQVEAGGAFRIVSKGPCLSQSRLRMTTFASPEVQIKDRFPGPTQTSRSRISEGGAQESSVF